MQTDAQIRDDVLAELEFEPSVDASAIGVSVTDGVVTLNGHVASYSEKIAAEEAIKRVKGVRAVAQEIDVRLQNDNKYDDAEIAARVANVIAWNVSQPKKGIKVRVEKGWVALRGEVGWNYQRDYAERSVRQLAGVAGVTNLITVRANATPRDVSTLITKALHRSAQLEATGISVEVDGGKVTLSGNVRAFYERQLAERAAWAVPGVSQVVDNIHVT